MQRTVMWIMIILGGVGLWRWQAAKHLPSSLDPNTPVVIEFRGPDDLLAQLRKVKTGQTIQLHDLAPNGEGLNTGPCSSDPAAKERAMRQLERLNQASTRSSSAFN